MSEEEHQKQRHALERSMWSALRPYRAQLLLASVFKFLAVVFTLGIPVLLGRTIDILAGENAQNLVPMYALAMIGVAVLMAVTFIVARVLFLNVSLKAQFDLQSHFYRHLLSLDSAFYRIHKIGDVLSRLYNDTNALRLMTGSGLYMLAEDLFLFTGAAILMLRLDLSLTLLVLLPYPIMFLLTTFLASRIFSTSKRVQEQLGSLSSLMEEDLNGIAVIKSYNLEKSQAEMFSLQSKQLLERNHQAYHYEEFLIPCLRISGAVAIAILFVVGGSKVTSGTITVGQLVEFHAYLLLLLWPTILLGHVVALNQRAQSAWTRISEILQIRPAINDGSKPGLLSEDVRGEVEFRDLTVKIDDSVLVEDVSLKIAPGTSIAIVGKTGSGKSSLISTLPRLLETPAGSVFLDGHDINELPLKNLRSFIGYAPQEAFLFSTSIANNIRHGVERRVPPPKDEAEMTAAILEAAKSAGLERDLEALPRGLETIVGERGVTLSGGQRQRVALARCLATKPRILILDDSLSSVDAETEQQILEGLRRVMKTGTALIISHRLTAVRSADRIAVLDGGRLVEEGVHEDLVKRQGCYFELYETQLNDGIGHGDQ